MIAVQRAFSFNKNEQYNNIASHFIYERTKKYLVNSIKNSLKISLLNFCIPLFLSAGVLISDIHYYD